MGLWEPATFDLIGNAFGRVVAPAQVSSLDRSMTHARVGVLTRSLALLEETNAVKRRDKSFKVWVVENREPWIPAFCINSGQEKSSELEAMVPETEKLNNRCMGNHHSSHADGVTVSKTTHPHALGGVACQNDGLINFSIGPDYTCGPSSKRRRRSLSCRWGSPDLGPGGFLATSVYEPNRQILGIKDGTTQVQGAKSGEIRFHANGSATISREEGIQKGCNPMDLETQSAENLDRNEVGRGPTGMPSKGEESHRLLDKEVEETILFGEECGIDMQNFGPQVRKVIIGEENLKVSI